MRQAGLPLTRKQALPTTTLLHGDCLEVMPTLPARSVHMVFSDLPFGLPSTQMAWDTRICLSSVWSSLSHVAIVPENIIFTATQPYASLIIGHNLARFRYEIVWQKNVATNFFNAKTQPLRCHESVLIFGRAGATYNPQKTYGQKPYKGIKKVENCAQFNESKRKPRAYASADGSRYPVSVQKFSGEIPSSRTHPTQKPVALLEWLIRTYTNEGDTVLDPVFGSCTTGVACLRTGRNFIGIEKDKTYYDIGCKRVADERARLEAL